MRKEETVQSSAPVGLRERQKQAREQAILEAAYDLVRETSYEAMTMDELAVRAGISKPTLYQHFPSKEAIAIRSIVQILEEWLASVRALNAGLAPLPRLELMIRQAVESRMSPRRMVYGAAKLSLVPVVRSNPEYQALFQALVAEISRIIDDCKAAGQVPAELNTRVLAQSVFSVLRDCEYEILTARGEVAREDVADTLTRLLLCGMCCAPERVIVSG